MQGPREIEVIEKSDTLTHLALNGRLDLQGVQAIETRFLAYTVARKKPALDSHVAELRQVDARESYRAGAVETDAASRGNATLGTSARCDPDHPRREPGAHPTRY